MAQISDGTTKWETRDKRLNEKAKAMIDLLYPVGIIISTTSATAPFSVGIWEEVGKGRVLQGCGTGQTAGNTVEAGLPNITGGMNPFNFWTNGGTIPTGTTQRDGCVTLTKWGNTNDGMAVQKINGDGWFNTGVAINAANANAIYGASETVQPPAYLVHFWRRTA